MGAKKSKCVIKNSECQNKVSHQKLQNDFNDKTLTINGESNNDNNQSDERVSTVSVDENLSGENVVNYEEMYNQLYIDHKKLENSFIELKSKLIRDDYMNRGDFVAYANDLSNRIHDIFYENDRKNDQSIQYQALPHNVQLLPHNGTQSHDLLQNYQSWFQLFVENENDNDEIATNSNLNYPRMLHEKLQQFTLDPEKQEKPLEKQQEETDQNDDDLVNTLKDRLQLLQTKYNEIASLQANYNQMIKENESKTKEIQNLQANIEHLENQYKNDIEKLKDEYNKKCLLLCERQEEEKKQINSLWETKFFEVMNSCGKDMKEYRCEINKDKTAIEKRLTEVHEELKTLSLKNKQLTELFDDIKKRYELRESRKEDLDKIADLEAQLLIQSEEIQKHELSLKQIKSFDGYTLTKNQLNDTTSMSDNGNEINRKLKKRPRKNRNRNFCKNFERTESDMSTTSIVAVQDHGDG